ncbi:hypothetical protein PanWU01x14_140690 [Parasponia andersonii]|uniref:Uncharacterized protein n=1 Tax=Parasponia andersonii TaxID=3476 RepID=A0A2P5CM30_PARAD|nr:hypothetical protein PanWU01x14_140690 [Parasponia andersonii]
MRGRIAVFTFVGAKLWFRFWRLESETRAWRLSQKGKRGWTELWISEPKGPNFASIRLYSIRPFSNPTFKLEPFHMRKKNK